MRRLGIVLFALAIYILVAGCGKDSQQVPASTMKAAEVENASLAITPADRSLPIQRMVKLKASVSLADGYTEEISEYARWKSSDDSIASIGNAPENKGIITGISPGVVLITAHFNNLTATARVTITQDNQESLGDNARVVFLHHSVGSAVLAGGVQEWLANYNAQHRKNYSIADLEFPKKAPYGWNNNPYDYWNIWVSHAGPQAYREEPTLEALTQSYNVIIWKHSFTASAVAPDTLNTRAQPQEKTIGNYKLEYRALKNKMRSFPRTRFIVWTGAAIVQGAQSEEQAQLAREFFTWVKQEWDEPGDNIYLWDFFELETGGGNNLKSEYSAAPEDSNPNPDFAGRVAPYFCKRVVDVIEGRGDSGPLKGK